MMNISLPNWWRNLKNNVHQKESDSYK